MDTSPKPQAEESSFGFDPQAPDANPLEACVAVDLVRSSSAVESEGILILTEGGIITSLNSAAGQIFGYSVAEVVGMSFTRLAKALPRILGEPPSTEALLSQLVGTGCELDGVRKDGTVFPLHVRASRMQGGDQHYFTAVVTDRSAQRKAGADHEEEKDLLAAILHTVAALVVVIDSQGVIVRFNRACEELTGYTFEEVCGQVIWDLLLAPEESAGVQLVFRQLLTAATPNDYENLWIAKNGTARRIAWRNTVLVGPCGQVTHIIGTGIDVTERRKAEAAQRELTTRFAATFENAAVGIAHFSPDGRWLRVNEKLCEITGYSREELLARTFSEITHPADVEVDWEQVQRLLRREIRTYSTEKRYIHKSGAIIWVALTVSLVAPASGPEYLITIVQEVTAARNAQLALRDSEQHLRRVLDNMYVFVGVLRPDGVLLHASRPPLEAAGITLDDVQGRNFWDCFWWTHSPSAQRKLRRAIETAGMGVPSRYDVVIQIAGGKSMTIDFMLSPMLNDEGQITHLIASAVDITSRKQLEREVLEISEREQRRIGQDLHDDLCQRLTAIEFLTHTVASDLAAIDANYASRVQRIAEYIRGSISHTRSLARGLSPVHLTNDGLATALRELANSTEEMFSVQCRFVLRSSIAPINQELGSQLYRIAQEAISNAIRHGHATEIVVRIEPSDDRLRMAIVDNGCGIRGAVPRSDGMGLRIMKHRAEIISATLDVRAGRTVGTEVTCTFSP